MTRWCVLLFAVSGCQDADPPPKSADPAGTAEPIAAEPRLAPSASPPKGSGPTAGASSSPAAPPSTIPSTSFAVVPVASPAPGPPPPSGFGAAASTCLADMGCPMARYASLILAAVDAGEESGACRDLLTGTGVPIDLVRARRCFETTVAREGVCGGNSPSSARLQLALLHVTGRGGPLSSAEASKRLEGCFEDASVQAVHELIAAQATGKGVNIPSIELCAAELAQTTLHMVGCLGSDFAALDIRQRALEKAVFDRFGESVGRSFRAVTAEHDAYRTLAADITGDPYAGGSIQGIQIRSAGNGIRERRIALWETLVRRKTVDAPDAKVARAELLRVRDATLAMSPPETMGQTFTAPQWRARLFSGEKAYGVYRAKEIALVKSIDGVGSTALEAAMDVDRTHTLGMLLLE